MARAGDLGPPPSMNGVIDASERERETRPRCPCCRAPVSPAGERAKPEDDATVTTRPREAFGGGGSSTAVHGLIRAHARAVASATHRSGISIAGPSLREDAVLPLFDEVPRGVASEAASGYRSELRSWSARTLEEGDSDW